MTKITPLVGQVAVRPTKSEQLSSIIVAKSVAPNTGTVVAVGPGYYKKNDVVPMQCAAGDKVLFNNTAAIKVRVDGEEIFMIWYHEIFAIVKPE